MLSLLYSALALSVTSAQAILKPNIVLVLTDDQDQLLGGMDHPLNIKRLLADEGANFTNFFVNTPVCCPSRTELLSGRYGHNNLIGEPGKKLPESGKYHKGCMWANVTGPNFLHRHVGTYLSKLGYQTGLFGKYMHPAPECDCPAEAGCKRGARGNMTLPPGWDRWFAACNTGTYFNNPFNDDGVLVTMGDKPEDYMTSVIGNRTVEWLQQVADNGKPFFAYVAPHAPHVADTKFPYITEVAPWYKGTMGNHTSPRTPNWNVPNRRAHPVIANQPLMDDMNIAWSDSLYRARVESMMSVDDLVKEIYDILKKKGVLGSTYIIFTSDHGYALGQQCRPSGKFHVYEGDVHIPMLVRGPGVTAGSRIPAIAGIVDLAATFVELAGGNAEVEELDGRSLAPWLTGKNVPTQWRNKYHIEYWSLGDVRRGAPVSPTCNPSEQLDCQKAGCACHYHQVDGPNNTYVASRMVDPDHGDFLLVQYYPDRTEVGDFPRDYPNIEPVFTEFYNMNVDLWQMNNLYPEAEQTHADVIKELREHIDAMSTCSGRTCRKADAFVGSGPHLTLV